MVRSQGFCKTRPLGIRSWEHPVGAHPWNWAGFSAQGRQGGLVLGRGRRDEKDVQVVLLINGKELFSGE